MGFKANDFLNMVEDGKFSINIGDGQIHFFDYDEDLIIKIDGDDMLNTEAGVSEGNVTTYEIEETCESMDIEFGAGILDIYYDDVDCIKVQQTNITGFKVNVKNDTLVIGGGADVNIDVDDVDDRSLTIIIPSEMKFEEVELEIGASQADIKDIQTDKLSITVGAGQANISEITAKQFDLEVGAGQAMAVQLSVDKLDVEAGLGEVNVALNGVQEDYNYSVECGIGNVVVGKSSYGGLGAEQSVRNEGATKEINVECGIGEVVIKFKE